MKYKPFFICLFLFKLIFLTSYSQEIIWDTTFSVHNNIFELQAGKNDSGGVGYIIKNKTDSITIEGVNGNIEVIFFNNDSFPDILVTFIGNVPISDLYLFSIEINDFVKVEGIRQYSQSRKLKQTDNLFYYYQRAGCADMNWVSHLFKIDSYKAISIGKLYGQGCNNNDKIIQVSKEELVDIETGLYIETIIDSIPYDTISSYEKYKWGFLEDYWNRNYNRFE